MKTLIYGEQPQAVVPGSRKIKLGKVLEQQDFGRYTRTTIESTLLDDAGNEIAHAPLFTSLPLNEIEVDENFVVTNARLSAPKDGKSAWLVKPGAGMGTEGIGYGMGTEGIGY